MSKISDFYSQFPFPNIPIYKKSDLYQTLIYRLIYGLSKKYLDQYKNEKIRILDMGCGTGELTLSLSDKNRDILGVDNNKKSIEIAIERLKKFKFRNIKFKNFNFLKEKLPKNEFDFIYSIGVLHHLPDPEKSFLRLIKSLKVGGYITIGIYNPYGSLGVRMKRGILKILAGDNQKKRIEIYRKIFYRRPLTLTEEVAVADAFANPYRRYYSFEELLRWFNKNQIEYLESVPPVEISKNLKLMKEIFKMVILGKRKDLMSMWQKINLISSTSSWERSKILTLFIQLCWVPIGRGELINIIGRKR